ncbi:MAG: hypothetical protein RQ824_08305, partial [bacterium]|nr:hypothetical protein [bacterium]
MLYKLTKIRIKDKVMLSVSFLFIFLAGGLLFLDPKNPLVHIPAKQEASLLAKIIYVLFLTSLATRDKLEEVKQAGEEAWEELKSGTEEAFDTMKSDVEKAL